MTPKSLPDWGRLPHRWIEQKGLWNYRWARGGEGVDSLAALMVFTALVHHMDQGDGSVQRTYDQLADATGLARATVSRGISAAAERHLITRPPVGRSSFQIEDFDPNATWAMFPVKAMYAGGAISAFKDFNLRRPAELDILKFFYLCVARRDRHTNTANITYQGIYDYSGIQSHNIKRATSGAAALSLVYMEQMQRGPGLHGVSNAYRIAGVYPRRHSGTIARDPADFDASGGEPWGQPRKVTSLLDEL